MGSAGLVFEWSKTTTAENEPRLDGGGPDDVAAIWTLLSLNESIGVAQSGMLQSLGSLAGHTLHGRNGHDADAWVDGDIQGC